MPASRNLAPHLSADTLELITQRKNRERDMMVDLVEPVIHRNRMDSAHDCAKQVIEALMGAGYVR